MIRGAPLDGDVLGERDSSDMGLLRGDPTPPCPLVKSGYPPFARRQPSRAMMRAAARTCGPPDLSCRPPMPSLRIVPLFLAVLASYQSTCRSSAGAGQTPGSGAET